VRAIALKGATNTVFSSGFEGSQAALVLLGSLREGKALGSEKVTF
jgi:hypothetical protein